MRIAFLCDEGEYETSKADIAVFAFARDVVDYEKELNGESCFFERLARLSKESANVVVGGCITNTLGQRRKSACVVERGKLLGVSDMLNATDGEVSGGAEVHVYPTSIGKIGLVVAEDLYDLDILKSLSLCGSDFLVCSCEKAIEELPAVMLRAAACAFGLPVLLCASNYCMAVDGSGKIAFCAPQPCCTFDMDIKKEYHLVERRKRFFLPS